MATDTLIFSIRAAAARFVLVKLPRSCPSWRDTNLQIAKLERMVAKFNKRFWPAQLATTLGGGATKAQNKAIGTEHARLNKQAQKLKASLNKTFEEGFYVLNPKSQFPRSEFRRRMVETTRHWEQAIVQATADQRKALFFGEGREPVKLSSLRGV